MINITGIGNLNELQVPRPVKGSRDLSATKDSLGKRDDVQFSTEGQQAVEVAHFLRESAKVQEIRQERVEEAKQNLEQGRHRVEEVVHAVAAALVGRI